MSVVQCPKCKKTKIAILEGAGMGMCWDCGYQFSLTDAAPENYGKTATPMHLFLSYGRPESPIVQKIYEALTERGHIPWFDQSEIRAGHDWRARIQKGVEDSQSVVACLSEHAVRERGVCLDELAIAVGVKGAGCIHSVLLGPEEAVQPPATVGQTQWLDMSSWREKMAQGNAAFQPWFNAKMQELFAILENKDNREFVGQISEIKKRLNVYYDTSLQNEYLKKEFVGREWLEKELENWLDDPDGGRMAFVHGEPGIGKTAFAVHYTHYNSRVAACLFCRAKMDTFNDPKTVIQTLAYLLACRLPSYRRSLLATMPETKAEIQGLNERELFSQLLTNPLSITIDGGFPTTVIVLDGLDECSGDPRENTLASTLYTYMNSLPRWLRFLVVARPTAPVRQYTRLACEIEIPSHGQQNLADIRAYFEQELGPVFGQDPQWEASLRSMTARSQGIFLYAEMLSVLLRSKGRLEAENEYPDGLDGVFSQWFAWFFPNLDEYAARWRLPLGCLIGAPAPLPEEELKKMFGWGDNELSDLILRLDVLLSRETNAFGDRTLAISHAYVRQWLGSKPGSHCYCTSPLDGAKKMAEVFYDSFRDNPAKLTFYEAVQLPGLLKQTGDEKRYAQAIENNDLLWRVLDAGDHCHAWGRIEAAQNVFERALQISKEASERTHTQNAMRNVGVCQNRLGAILYDMGNLNRALELYEKGLAIAEQLAAERGTPADRRDLSVSCNKVAGIREAQGDLNGALELYEKSLAIREQLAAERGTPADRRDLSVSCNNVADIREAQGDLNGALELYEKGLAITEQLVKERGTLADRRDLSVSYEKVAGIREAQGDLNGALELYEKDLAIAEQLAAERGTPEDRRDLSVSCDKVANIREAQGNLNGALELYEKSLIIREQLAVERGTPADRRDLSINYEKVADIRKVQGNLNGALELYEKGLAIAEQLVKERGTPADRRDLSVSYDRVADIRKAQGDLNGALKLYEKGLAIAEQLAAERGTPDDRRDLWVSYNKVAGIREAQDDLNGAVELYEKGLAITEQLVKERGAPEDRRGLSVSYDKVADIRKAQGDLNSALELYEKGLAITEQLVKERGTPEDRRDLSFVYGQVADIRMMQNNFDRASELHKKALMIREQLAAERGTVTDNDDLMVSCFKMAAIQKILEEPIEKTAVYITRGRAIAQQLLAQTGQQRYRQAIQEFDELDLI